MLQSSFASFPNCRCSLSCTCSCLFCYSLVSSFFHSVPCLAFCTSGGLSPPCFPALTFGRPLHCTGSRLRVRRRNFIFFSPPVLFQIFHSQELHQMKAPSVSQRDFPKLSFTALPLTYSKGRSYKPQLEDSQNSCRAPAIGIL